MENTSTTILTESTLHDERAALHVSSRDLVAHELAHQWFGDLVTCEDWAHIWINESFATFFETEYRGHLLGEDEEVYGRKEQADDYFYEDRNEYRRPLVTRRYRYPGDMFDNHSYPKGARIVAMLENVLGHKTFYEGLKLFLTREAYQSVDTEDLRKALEDVSGRSLIWFFDQWIYSGGHPEYHVTSEWDDEAKAVRLTVKQVQVLDEVTRLFRMPVDIEVTTKSGAEMHRIEIAKEEETHNFPCESRPLMVRFDKHGWILKELTFEKAREEWLYQLVHDDNILGRMQAAKALGERSGDLTARDALLSRLTEEPFWGVRESIVEALSGFTAGVVRTGLVEAFAREKKSQVRVQVVKSLKELEHEDTSAFLRHAFETDLSYYVAAEALEVLSEVSEDNIFRVLLDALERSSHRDVIRRAALRVIAKMHEEADLESEQLEKAVTAMIPLVEPRHSVSIRRAALNALARLGRGAPEALRGRIFHALANVVDDSFLGARVAAFAALGALGDERGVDLLIARRSKEGERPFRNPLDIIDRAVTAIRAGDGDEDIRRRFCPFNLPRVAHGIEEVLIAQHLDELHGHTTRRGHAQQQATVLAGPGKFDHSRIAVEAVACRELEGDLLLAVHQELKLLFGQPFVHYRANGLGSGRPVCHGLVVLKAEVDALGGEQLAEALEMQGYGVGDDAVKVEDDGTDR